MAIKQPKPQGMTNWVQNWAFFGIKLLLLPRMKPKQSFAEQFKRLRHRAMPLPVLQT
jgi:hypothetical protein